MRFKCQGKGPQCAYKSELYFSAPPFHPAAEVGAENPFSLHGHECHLSSTGPTTVWASGEPFPCLRAPKELWAASSHSDAKLGRRALAWLVSSHAGEAGESHLFVLWCSIHLSASTGPSQCRSAAVPASKAMSCLENRSQPIKILSQEPSFPCVPQKPGWTSDGP